MFYNYKYCVVTNRINDQYTAVDFLNFFHLKANFRSEVEKLWVGGKMLSSQVHILMHKPFLYAFPIFLFSYIPKIFLHETYLEVDKICKYLQAR